LRGCVGEKYCLSYVKLLCSTVFSHVHNRLLAMSVTSGSKPTFYRASHSDTAKLCLIACDTVQSKSRRRAGRPITYKDNPDAKNLTEGERRKVKRRIANRESARRVRARRAETLEELQIKVRPVSAHLRLIMT